MKKILYSVLFAACASAGLSSCMNGDYDANPVGVVGGNNPLNPPGGGGGGGNASSASYYSWNGTDPMSAKINGADFLATSASAMETSGIILVQGTSGTTIVQVAFDGTTPPNTVILITPNVGTATAGLMEGTNLFSSGAGTGGGIYVMENDATHVKGKFFFNAKDPIGSAGSRDITVGYFNVTK